MKIRSRLAHTSMGFAVTMGVNQASDTGLASIVAPVASLALGALWEYGGQPLLAKAFPKWNPKPNPKELWEWVVGAGFGALLDLVVR